MIESTKADTQLARAKIEQLEEWDSVIKAMPILHFPAGWGVKVIPPFGGAMARFVVVNSHGAHVSVYADFYGRLGVVSHPYWEIYCTQGRLAYDYDDVERFDLDRVEDMIEAIGSYGDPGRNMVAALKQGED